MYTLIFAIPLAVWIYLIWLVRKKKVNLFDDQMEPKLAERRLKRLKTFLLVGGISFVVFIVGLIVNFAVYYPSETDEPVSFIIAYLGFGVFVIATIGGLVVYLKGRQKTS